ncbi:putative peptidoglycan lipid II flippase [Reinekea marinisedimentorum]|uniref:Probable lipid II flippase MurJ n=1 Tax=Reinekea marinisedimentorum TaxID=230495 RepID=A0A4R3HTV2_9GAMM|nr:putative peptidoglycan lipid II flippase [Reinekea marinisedimentorum]
MVSAATMFSRVLGLIRDIVFASMFGTGGAQDAFVVAFKIPNFLRRLFAEGAFNQAFIPVLTEFRQSEGDRSVARLVSAVQIYLSGIVGLITLVAVLGSPLLAWLFAPGFHDDGEKLVQVSDFLRLTFPYLWFISLTALATSVLNSYGRFAAPALTPVILNLCLISSALFLTPHFQVPQTGLAIGVLVAGMLQWLFLWPALLKTGVWSPVPAIAQHAGVKKIFTLMLPGLFGVSVSQINLLLDTVLASLLEDGSVSWLYYSDRLTELPLGVIGIAIATVLLPRLSALHVEDDTHKFERTLAWAIRIVLLIGLPAMVALMILPEVLLTLLFQNYQFTAADVSKSAASLAAYALGLPAFMLIKIMAPAFFSRQDTKTPVKIGIQAMVWNMLLNLILIYPLAHVGLALATSLSAWFNACLLALSLRKQGCFPAAGLWLRPALKAVFACAVMAVSLELLMQLAWLQMPNQVLGRVRVVTVLVAAGILSYGLALIAVRTRLNELRHP